MREINLKERETLSRIIDGRLDVNTRKAQETLARPHVAITFEAILNKARLTDENLAKRINKIVVRKPTKGRTSTGAPTTNITSIDANVINTVRMIWQAKGKFVEKHEIKHGPLSEMKDEELDKLIRMGMEFLRGGGKASLHGLSGGQDGKN